MELCIIKIMYAARHFKYYSDERFCWETCGVQWGEFVYCVDLLTKSVPTQSNYSSFPSVWTLAANHSKPRSRQIARAPQTIHLLIRPNSDGRGWLIMYACGFAYVCVGENVDMRKYWESECMVLSLCEYLCASIMWDSLPVCVCYCRKKRQGQNIPALHRRWTEDHLGTACVYTGWTIDA